MSAWNADTVIGVDSSTSMIAKVKEIIENYISDNNVCALATGTGDYVRCTPLEYSYHDGKFWIFSEGGETLDGICLTFLCRGIVIRIDFSKKLCYFKNVT